MKKTSNGKKLFNEMTRVQTPVLIHLTSSAYQSSGSPFFVDYLSRERCTDNLMKQVFQDLKVRSGIERFQNPVKPSTQNT